VFHSVSAFCTAGFGLFADSLSQWHASPVITIIASIGAIAGGIGFLALSDLLRAFGDVLHGRLPRSLSIHTKLVLLLTVALMVAGTIILFLAEPLDSATSSGEHFLHAGFQAVSASSTTGFNTVDIGAMRPASIATIIVLMVIGASPGGTGGGIKTVVFGVMMLFLFSVLRGREEARLFRRRIAPRTVNRVFAAGFIALLWLTAVTVLLTATENAPFVSILFEAASALGTVGLSMGITSALSDVGKLAIILSMFVGRVGLLAIGFSLIRQAKTSAVQYPEAEIFTG
jgi:trk system potassium uptake protein TrkH